jgi:hypothetical protein
MTRIKNLIVITGIALAVYTFVTWLGGCIAHADTGAAQPETSGAADLLAKHGWWGGALIAYSAAAWFLKKNQSAKWIAQGRTLAIVAAALSVIGPIIGWQLGLDPDAIVYSLTGAIPLVMSPTVTSSGGAGS